MFINICNGNQHDPCGMGEYLAETVFSWRHMLMQAEYVDLVLEFVTRVCHCPDVAGVNLISSRVI